MVMIVFESHATTRDNEFDIASGTNDIELSKLGFRQAEDLGKRYAGENFDAIFCSDLQRSYRTAEIAFGNRDFKIIRDVRLREADYGNLNGAQKSEVDPVKKDYIDKPFPEGESYKDMTAKMRSFLADLLKHYDGKRVMIVGHRATQYRLEHIINHLSLAKAVADPWQWRSRWIYHLQTL